MPLAELSTKPAQHPDPVYIKRVKGTPLMTPYPLGIDNPIKVKAVMGSHKWAIYWKDDFTKIATFNSQFQAYQARQSILESNK